MPKQKSVKASRAETPYSLSQIKANLKSWKTEALEYEKRTQTHYDQIKAYISQHMDKMTSDQTVDLYDCVSKALDTIERKGTQKLTRLDSFLTNLVEDKNLSVSLIIHRILCPYYIG